MDRQNHMEGHAVKLTMHQFVTLDGVMQGPGGPDEDRSNGFDRGGWQVPFTSDPDFGRIVGTWFEEADAFLLGRTTYDMMSAFWTQVSDPDDVVAANLNSLPKYVVSTTLTDPTWPNTTVISTDIVESVRSLKDKPGRELQISGSWQLARTLHDVGLVDEYRILVFPVVVGPGKRLFDADTTPTGFTVVDTDTTASGATYHVLRPTPFRAGEYVVEDGKDVASVLA